MIGNNEYCNDCYKILLIEFMFSYLFFLVFFFKSRFAYHLPTLYLPNVVMQEPDEIRQPLEPPDSSEI